MTLSFDPDPAKTFNWGQTDYFLEGRKGNITSFETPKSRGEKIGTVKKVAPACFLSAKELNRLRRDLVQALADKRAADYQRSEETRPGPVDYIDSVLDFRGNVTNRLARQFYEKRGVKEIAPGFETATPGRSGSNGARLEPGTPVKTAGCRF